MNATPIADVIADARNGWIHSFAHASNRIAHALVNGAIDPSDIEQFHLGKYDEAELHTIAEGAGLRLDVEGGSVRPCSAEDIDVAVEAIRGLTTGSVCTYEEPDTDAVWMLYQRSLDEHGVTIDEVRKSVRGRNIREAAALIVAADERLGGRK